MKRIFILICLVAFIGCQDNSEIEAKKFKTIMIKSVGNIEVLPDMATFSIELSCIDKSVKASKNCLIDKSNELNLKLQSYEISQDDILTTSVNMSKSYTWRNNSNVFEGYRSSTNVFVTVKNLDNLDEIYTELLDNRNLSLSGLNYSHSNLDDLKNQAYVDALKKSEILTDKLLKELPENKKEILKIGNIEISASLPTNEFNDQNANAIVEEVQSSRKQSISISKGTVNVFATLFVEYLIK